MYLRADADTDYYRLSRPKTFCMYVIFFISYAFYTQTYFFLKKHNLIDIKWKTAAKLFSDPSMQSFSLFGQL